MLVRRKWFYNFAEKLMEFIEKQFGVAIKSFHLVFWEFAIFLAQINFDQNIIIIMLLVSYYQPSSWNSITK